ncbi:hypothetical protein C0993_011931 [Termitomyces sp. T159_Od127]|nr:hypothetical protein C0993_011931 [Termitomyces sp. T159_Od127]
MPSKKQYLHIAAAQACAQALKTRQEPSLMLPIDAEPGSPRTQAQSPIVVDSDFESETAYQGGVNHYSTTSNDETDLQDGLDDGFKTVSEFSEEDVVVMAGRKSPTDTTVVFMHKYFVAKPASLNTPGISSTNKSSVVEQYTPAELVYFSDDDTGNYEANDKDEGELESDSTESNVIKSIPVVDSTPSQSRLPIAPPPKRHRLEVPVPGRIMMDIGQKKSFRHLKGPMDQVIKHYSWLTILKAIQHMLKMPWLQTA